MKIFLLFLSIVISLFLLAKKAGAQNNQTVANGAVTTAVNFPGAGCIYNWVNNTPGIGLAASGTGDIPPFVAINNGSSPVTATIKATPSFSSFVYVANSGDNTVSVINVATNLVAATIPVGSKPLSLSVNSDGSRVYVANSGDNSISVINTLTNTVIYTITQVNSPYCVKVNPKAGVAYVSNYNSKTLTVINTATNAIVTTIPVGNNPANLCVSPDGAGVYLIDGTSNLDAISTTTNTVIATIPVGGTLTGVSVSPDGNRVYIASSTYNYIEIVDRSTLGFISELSFTGEPYDIAVSPDGSTGYSTIVNSGIVSAVNLSTTAVISQISVGAQPGSLFLSADGSLAYVANEGSNNVSVINTSTNKVIATIPVGSNPNSVDGFIPAGPACPPVTYTITVSPTPPLTITAGAASGSISACAGTASASPGIQQFTVSARGLTGNITATAPADFEVSLSPGGGYGSSLALNQTGGSVDGIVYVRSAASAPVGKISGNVVLSSPGTNSQDVAVAGTVNAVPTVNPVSNQTVNNGQATAAINFTGTGKTFKWVNDTPGIGLAASGNGDIASFTAVNNGSSPVTATITVTPISAQYAYITNFNANSIAVVNVSTNTVLSEITVGSNPVGVSVSPDGGRVYVTNEQSNTVSVINTASNTVVATIAVGRFPYGIAVSPDGKTVYVANDIDHTVSVINTATNTVTATIATNGAAGITVSPDGSKVYVSNSLDPTGIVSVIDAATNTVLSTITDEASPIGIVVSADGSRVYTANNGTVNVSVINTATEAVIATIPMAGSPWGISISPDGGTVYVGNAVGNTISVINTATNVLAATIPVGDGPYFLTVSPDGSLLYVNNTFDNTVSVISTATNTVTSTITGFSGPFTLGNFISAGSDCPGVPLRFTITVNPTTPLPAITAGQVSGNISACAGMASASPDVEQFTVSGSDLTGNIAITAPTGFEVSVAAAGGYSNGLTLTQSGGTVSSTVVYVRSAISAVPGGISGDVVLASPGAANQTVAVTGSVNAPVAPSVSIAASANNTCIAVPVTFTATPTSGGSAPVYQWLVNGSNTGTNNAIFSSSALANGDIISCVMTSNAACIAPDNATSNNITMNIASPSGPSISIAATASDICAGTPVTFTAVPTNGGSAPVYQWLLNGNTAGTNNAAFTSSTLANGDIISCEMTSNGACVIPANATSNSITMIVNPLPVVSAGGNKTIKDGGSTILNGSAPGNTADITWSPQTGLSNNKILNPAASPSSTTTYTLVVETTDGCVGMDMATVEVLPQNIIIPNTFTPNSDGVNDTWDIKYLNGYPNCTVEIFNRWGQNVYSSIGYGVPWNGTYKGAALPTGTYYYIINLKNSSKLLSGFVAIIR